MFDITEGANTLTRRSSIRCPVTALLIHCSPIKCRLISRKFTAFMSSRIATKSRNAIKAHDATDVFDFAPNTWNGPCGVSGLISPLGRFSAPLEAAGAVMWQRNGIISPVFRHGARTPLVPHWCDKPAPPAGRAITTPSRNETTVAEVIGGEIIVLKMKLWLMDAIVFATVQSE